jgi:hypothetical protein
MKCVVRKIGDRESSTAYPEPLLPTLEQFRRAHESLWMRPAYLAAYERTQQALGNQE